MVKKSKRRIKHTPRRTCVGCREVLPKSSMTRIVKGPEGVNVDPSGKAHGRGAYLHDIRSCWLRGIDGGLNHSLRTTITDQEKQNLLTYMETHFSDEKSTQRGAEELSG